MDSVEQSLLYSTIDHRSYSPCHNDQRAARCWPEITHMTREKLAGHQIRWKEHAVVCSGWLWRDSRFVLALHSPTMVREYTSFWRILSDL